MSFSEDLLFSATAARSREAAAFVRSRAGCEPYAAALVLGTGLGSLADELESAVAVDYRDIPHFPHSGVSGHAGRLVTGTLQGRRVAILQGRVHYYERGDAGAMRLPLEMLALLHVPVIILTNSSGSLRTQMPPGSLVAINDHINWHGANPLIGDESDARFVTMTDAYDKVLLASLSQAAGCEGIALPQGVYAWFGGPSFETPAEIRLARALGADLVGMSTVPEVILARRLGLRVAAVSMVTNYGAGMDEGETISHAQTKRVALAGADRMKTLMQRFIRAIPE